MRVIAIDPGLMTGLSVWDWEDGSDPVLLASEEVTDDDYAERVRYWMDNSFPDRPVMVCERFIITPETAKKSQAPYSLELIGQLKLIMKDRYYEPKTELVMQSPSDAKKWWTNPKMKKLGYWHVGGAGHALDSMRHGLLYFVKAGWKPTGLLS